MLGSSSANGIYTVTCGVIRAQYPPHWPTSVQSVVAGREEGGGGVTSQQQVTKVLPVPQQVSPASNWITHQRSDVMFGLMMAQPVPTHFSLY